VGWCLGIGRAGSIAGPIVAAQLIARNWSADALFLFAAVPALLSSIAVRGMSRLKEPNS
jgi:AAHS family 4-hydroxybenzoate transporter-like MFS transporter